MRLGIAVLVALLAAPAFAQQTAEAREETFEKQVEAERTAGEARRRFAELREGRGDRAHACRAASQADHQYREAIHEAQQLAKDAKPPLLERIEDRIRGMKERRDNLADFSGRLCEAGGLQLQRDRRPGALGARGGRLPIMWC
jgi:hypothetical protein